jgi:hypothetical protein
MSDVGFARQFLARFLYEQGVLFEMGIKYFYCRP